MSLEQLWFDRIRNPAWLEKSKSNIPLSKIKMIFELNHLSDDQLESTLLDMKWNGELDKFEDTIYEKDPGHDYYAIRDYEIILQYVAEEQKILGEIIFDLWEEAKSITDRKIKKYRSPEWYAYARRVLGELCKKYHKETLKRIRSQVKES